MTMLQLRRVLSGLTAVLALSVVNQAFAAGGIDSNGYVGGMFGAHIPDAEDTSARAGFGIVGGAKLGTEFGLGAYYLTSSKEEDANGIDFDFNYSMYGLEAAYHFEGEAAGAYFGARVGMTSLEMAEGEDTPYHFGLMAGYNHWLSDNFSLGGEAAFFNVAESEDDIDGNGVVTEGEKLAGFNIISLMASAKFWF